MSMRNRIVIAAALSALMASTAFAVTVDTPAIGAGVAGHAKQTITITAGPSGLPNGFAIWWMDQSTFMASGGVWPANETAATGAADFTGQPTLNTFGGQFTTFKLAPNQSVVVEVGDLLQETGVSGTKGELLYGETYYFTAFGLTRTEARRATGATEQYDDVGTNCTYTQGFWKNHESRGR
jgi:hypothetical protein